MKNLILTVGIVLGLAVASCEAGLCINLQETASGGVRISWNGSGTINPLGGNPAQLLDFNNFSGSPFGSSIAGAGNNAGSPFSLVNGSLDLAVTPPTLGFGFTNSYNIRLDNEGNGASDFDFQDPGSNTTVAVGSSYVASGSATVSDLLFSSLNIGTYVADNSSGGTGDAFEFDTGSGGPDEVTGVTLKITGIPEPTSLTLFALAVGSCLLGPRRRRLVG